MLNMASGSTDIKRVGILMTEKKLKSTGLFSLPDLSRPDISFFMLTTDEDLQPLNLDVIVQKLPELLSTSELVPTVADRFTKFISKNPHILCIDHPLRLRALAHRTAQFSAITGAIRRSSLHGIVHVPPFCVLETNDQALNTQRLIEFSMVLVFNSDGLRHLSYPVLAQQFENHSNILFKLFVIGDHVFVCQRPSIPDLFASNDRSPVFFDSRTVSKPGHGSLFQSQSVIESHTHHLTPQDDSILRQLAQVVRKTTDLELLGLDVIRRSEPLDTNSCGWAIVDMNIFPSYSEVHNFPLLLEDLVRSKLGLTRLLDLVDEAKVPGSARRLA